MSIWAAFWQGENKCETQLDHTKAKQESNASNQTSTSQPSTWQCTQLRPFCWSRHAPVRNRRCNFQAGQASPQAKRLCPCSGSSRLVHVLEQNALQPTPRTGNLPLISQMFLTTCDSVESKTFERTMTSQIHNKQPSTCQHKQFSIFAHRYPQIVSAYPFLWNLTCSGWGFGFGTLSGKRRQTRPGCSTPPISKKVNRCTVTRFRGTTPAKDL